MFDLLKKLEWLNNLVLTTTHEHRHRVLWLSSLLIIFIDNNILLRDLLSFCKNVHPVPPNSLRQKFVVSFVAGMLFLVIKSLISNVHDKVCNF